MNRTLDSFGAVHMVLNSSFENDQTQPSVAWQRYAKQMQKSRPQTAAFHIGKIIFAAWGQVTLFYF